MTFILTNCYSGPDNSLRIYFVALPTQKIILIEFQSMKHNY